MVQRYKVQNKYYNICEITGNKESTPGIKDIRIITVIILKILCA